MLTTQTHDGLRVIHVEPDSPAGSAGIEIGDLLIDVDGIPLKEQSDLARALAEARWGDAILVTLERNDDRRGLAVTLRR